ncbi:hypothetical protein CSIM01_04650 [Colletotrichum simmondsii]|uniref:Uncharacterized protein n=1 Tax=Colletotrichum simmondsii TaxID=703756 RepID=A0A135SGY3_9PEZI|nr:hypothetical protein CSIM01_04650 [Colletotrichum simmondsii]
MDTIRSASLLLLFCPPLVWVWVWVLLRSPLQKAARRLLTLISPDAAWMDMDESSQNVDSVRPRPQREEREAPTRIAIHPTTQAARARNKRLLTPRTVISHRAAQPFLPTPHLSDPPITYTAQGDWSLTPKTTIDEPVDDIGEAQARRRTYGRRKSH